jgi:predicted nucleotide-binding protein
MPKSVSDGTERRESSTVRNTGFPRNPLNAALRIAQAIHEKNGGTPMPPMDVALAIGSSPGSSSFRDLLSSSFKYGLTTGAFNQPLVALTPLGTAIVQPVSPEGKQTAMLEAAFKPPVFRQICDYFEGKKLPESPYFENTVSREFAVPKDHSAECVETFAENAALVGLIRNLPTGKWLGTETLPRSPSAPSPDAAESTVEDRPASLAGGTAVPQDSVTPRKNVVFVGHGKNKAPVEQLKSVLNKFHIPFKIATEEANRGRPISQKVAETMKECGAAILIFTADEELRNVAGETIWRPSENVVHELGAASVLYDQKIVIFKEEGLDFPTNFHDVGHITFPKDDLSSKTSDLFAELMGLGILKLSVT